MPVCGKKGWSHEYPLVETQELGETASYIKYILSLPVLVGRWRWVRNGHPRRSGRDLAKRNVYRLFRSGLPLKLPEKEGVDTTTDAPPAFVVLGPHFLRLLIAVLATPVRYVMHLTACLILTASSLADVRTGAQHVRRYTKWTGPALSVCEDLVMNRWKAHTGGEGRTGRSHLRVSVKG